MVNRIACLSTAVLTASLCVLMPARSFAIDRFTAPQALLTASGAGGFANSSVDDADILGGERDIDVFTPSGATLTAEVTGDLLVADATNASDGFVHVVWDGDDNMPSVLNINHTGLGGYDLTAGGITDNFYLLAASGGSGDVYVEIFTDAANSSSYTFSVPNLALLDDFDVPFTSFVVQNGAGADFTNVGAIYMRLEPTPGEVLRLDIAGSGRTMTARLDDTLQNDLNSDGQFGWGDTIRYTTTLNNGNDQLDIAADNTMFTLAPDSNTSLVVGSVATSQGTITTGNTAGDTTVAIDVGTIPDATLVTITFDVVIDDPLPGGVTQVAAQGFITSSISTNQQTDDAIGLTVTTDPTVTMVKVTVCGDSVPDSGEECDDGNAIDNDDCTNACLNPTCGDNIIWNQGTGLETCDTGGETATCDDDCTAVTCGDNNTNTTAGEACDDGGESATCDADCSLALCGDGQTNGTAGETCDTAGESATCDADCTAPVCGDTVTNMAAGEECDDGGETPTCNANCTFVACGDGILNPAAGEACDDAGESATCDADCTEVVCGDGVHNTTAGEFCDDGAGSASCDSDCTAPMCGDGVVNPFTGEACDDAGESAACDADCSVSTCGDSTVNTAAGEACDDGGQSSTCDADCTAAECGDGLLNQFAGEQCDDAGESAACDVDCTPVVCGDGVTNTTIGEQCDDMGTSDMCDADCTEAVCGDGVLNPLAGEACDEGGVPSDTCNAGCQVPMCGDGFVDDSLGEECDSSGEQNNECEADCRFPVCGDGVLNTMAGEICDDGNNSNADECLNNCTIPDSDGVSGGGCTASGRDTTGWWLMLALALLFGLRRRRAAPLATR